MIGVPHHHEPDLQLGLAGEAPGDWSELVASDRDADYFHTRHWTESVAAADQNRSALWLTVRTGERLVAGLAALQYTGGRVERVDSSLEGTSGGPVVASDLPTQFAASLASLLIDRFFDLRSSPLGALSLSLNPGHEARFGELLVGDGRWRRNEHPTAVVPLDGGLEFVESKCLNKNKRNERNRALRRGVEIEITHDPQRVAEYYRIYLEATRRWKVAPAPLDLLQSLVTAPDRGKPGQGDAFFTSVSCEGELLGGHLNLHYGDRVVAWNGVTDPQFSRSHFPATAAIWGDLEESCQRGARWLDLGGSGGLYSLDTFKKSFGAQTQVRGWYTSETPLLRFLRGVRGLGRRWTGRKA